MATTGDPTDPRGTKRPNEDPILVSAHTFRPVITIERPCKVCLPSHIQPNDAYGIFSLFFTHEVLAVIVKNTNIYGAQHYRHLKTAWQDTLVIELRAFLGILIYCSLYSHPRHKDLWNTDPLKPIHLGLTQTLSRDRFTQLEACIHVSDPDVKGDMFSKLEPVNSMLLKTCKDIW